MRVAEVDLYVRRGGDALVHGELGSLVPGQRIAQEFGQALRFVDDGLPDVFGVVPMGQVQKYREPDRALDERADRALVAGSGDEVALPVAGHRPVLHPGRSFADHDRGFAKAWLAVRFAPGLARGAPLSPGAFDLLPEFAPGLQVDGLADRLDARVHVSIIREVQPQPVGYLLRAPMLAQPGGDLAPQSRALGRLARFGAFGPVRRLLLGAVGFVVSGPGVLVAFDLAADRAGVAARQSRDGADPVGPNADGRRSGCAPPGSGGADGGSWVCPWWNDAGPPAPSRSCRRRGSCRCATPCRCVSIRRRHGRPG